MLTDGQRDTISLYREDSVTPMGRSISSFVTALARPLYDHLLRPHLPYRLGYYNRVAVKGAKLLDLNEPDVKPDREGPYVTGLQQAIKPGDSVVLIGGGWGISAVYAARFVGEGGQVEVFEGAPDQVERVEFAASVNEAGGRIRIIEGVVGDPVDVFGRASENRIDPADLPKCDVLGMDAEGSELSILSDLTDRPRGLVVETHADKGAPTPRIRTLVEEIGYDVVSIEPDEDNDIVVARYSQ